VAGIPDFPDLFTRRWRGETLERRCAPRSIRKGCCSTLRRCARSRGREDGDARSRPIAPGTYWLEFAGLAADVSEPREVVIVAGVQSALELAVEPPRR
jgi:hypothetical protein